MINNILNYTDVNQINKNLTINKIKKELKKIGEKSSGKKNILVNRLFNYIMFKKKYLTVDKKTLNIINLKKFSKLKVNELKEYSDIYSIVNTLEKLNLDTNQIGLKLKKKLYIFAKKYVKCEKNVNKIIKIQKTFKSFLKKKINNFKKYTLDDCINKEDFLTFENLCDIDKKYLFIYKDDKDGKIYGFDIRSLIEFFNGTKKYYNPYNNNLFTKKTKKYMVDFYYHLKNNLKTDIYITKTKISDQYLYIRDKAISVFQIMNVELNNYVDVNWFLNLNKFQLRKLYKNAEDIWNYRAQHLTKEIKKKHIPNLNAFKMSVHEFYKISNINQMRKIILNEFYKFITEGETIEECKTGAMWMLTALVEVSPEACNAMPWLLQLN